MGMPFKLTFTQIFGMNESIIEATSHFNIRGEEREKEPIILQENSEFDISFEAPASAKLYVDEIEHYEPTIGSSDEHGFYMSPRDSAYEIYRARKQKPYPFIPGRYIVTVSYDGKWYDASLQVTTRRVLAEQHMQMVEDLEEIEKGLAMQVSEKRQFRAGILDTPSLKEREHLLYIAKHQKAFENALRSIQYAPYEEVVKQYDFTPIDRVRRFDEKVIRSLIQEGQQNEVLAAKSTITVDVQPNRYVKHFSTQLLRMIRRVHTTDPKLRQTLRPIRHALHQFLQCAWVQRVSPLTVFSVPPFLLSGGAYTTVYRMLRYRRKAYNDVLYGKQLQYKRSDELYELWGFMKLAESFQRIGYSVDQEETVMEEAQRIWALKKESTFIRLVYDEPVPRDPRAMSKKTPYYTLQNNRPDCRIDVWEKEQLCGSLVIDFKYRNPQFIWQESILQTTEEVPSTMMQLEAYASNFRTDFRLLGLEQNRYVEMRPVHEVWVLYPLKATDAEMKSKEEERMIARNPYGIRLLDMSPSFDHTYLDEMLYNTIEEMKHKR